MIFTAAQNRRPANTSWIGRAVARRPIAAFLILACGVGWPTLLAADRLGLPLLLVSSLGVVLGLALPAFLVTAATGGVAGGRGLLGRCLRGRGIGRAKV